MASKQDDDNISAEAPASLRRRAEQDLRQAILSGRYQAGERLKERELMASLGVSRTLLREALRQVEAEGLVELVLNRGPVVARLTYEDAEEIYEVRGILEAQSCVGFALRASSVHMKRLEDVFGQLKQAAEAGDVARTLALSDSFYDVIADGCGNSVLSVMLKQLHNRIVLLRRTSLSEPGRLPETLDELAHIYQALHARDEDAARKASIHHVRQASRVALRAIRREPR